MNEECILDSSNEVTIKYDAAYYERCKERCYTDIGKKLHQFRRLLVEIVADEKPILDFGCGYGELVAGDTSGMWHGYDILPKVQDRLGVMFDPEPVFSDYRTICMFDVLGHLPNPMWILQTVAKDTFLVVTIPCWERWDTLQAIDQWKHYRPGEHFLYASKAGLVEYMNVLGFSCMLTTDYESFIGRQDVVTFIFRKTTPVLPQ
jgi:2-polyprenyl-3-methyl-5-hydroxy-6-metoxy-1,4-benzoquinol methylase